jgi:cytosine/adenosine deaminase-related metal-dependent hydrolase
MRFLTADYLYTLANEPIKKGVLQVDDSGKIINIYRKISDVPSNKIDCYTGVLCPGFINAHCHLELSHLKESADKVKGFSEFLSIIQKRNKFSKQKILSAIENSENEMIKNGIVGVGDICNTLDTLLQKSESKIRYYNFIETFEVDTDKSEEAISLALIIREKFRSNNLQATISPHAPYSVTPNLMKIISDVSDNLDFVFSIHNQETRHENILFEHKEGEFYNWLCRLNASSEIWESRASSSNIIKELNTEKRILFVHNTYSRSSDLTDEYYCTCPNANLFIEQRLPDYSIFHSDYLCVGTDSLASNNNLSIINELSHIQKNSNYSLETLLKIACRNGARALGFNNLGTFEIGKRPGVNLISDYNFGLESASVTKII